MAWSGRTLRMDCALRHHRSKDELALSQPPHGSRPRARRPDLRPKHRPNAASEPPSRPGRPPVLALARAAGLHQNRHPRHQPGLFSGCHNSDSPRGRLRRRFLPRFYLLRRRRQPRHDHQPRLGKPPTLRHRRRASRLLGTHQPDALCRARHGPRPPSVSCLRKIRSHHAPRTYSPDARLPPPPWRRPAYPRASLRPLLSRTFPVFLHRWLPHARLLPLRPLSRSCRGRFLDRLLYFSNPRACAKIREVMDALLTLLAVFGLFVVLPVLILL